MVLVELVGVPQRQYELLCIFYPSPTFMASSQLLTQGNFTEKCVNFFFVPHTQTAPPNKKIASVVRDEAYPQTLDMPSVSSPLLEIK